MVVQMKWRGVGIVALVAAVCLLLYFSAVGWPFTRVPHYAPSGVLR